MLKEALEYFRGLDGAVFLTLLDNGEPYEDHWTSMGIIAYRSIDELIKREKMKGRILIATKNQVYGNRKLEKGTDYSLVFEWDRERPEIKKMNEELNELYERIWGEGEEIFEKMNKKDKKKIENKYDRLQSKLSGIEHDYSSIKIKVAWLK